MKVRISNTRPTETRVKTNEDFVNELMSNFSLPSAKLDSFRTRVLSLLEELEEESAVCADDELSRLRVNVLRFENIHHRQPFVEERRAWQTRLKLECGEMKLSFPAGTTYQRALTSSLNTARKYKREGALRGKVLALEIEA